MWSLVLDYSGHLLRIFWLFSGRCMKSLLQLVVPLTMGTLHVVSKHYILQWIYWGLRWPLDPACKTSCHHWVTVVGMVGADWNCQGIETQPLHKSIFPWHAHTCAVDVICLYLVQTQHCCAPLIAITTTTLAWDGDCFLVGQGVGQMENGKFSWLLPCFLTGSSCLSLSCKKNLCDCTNSCPHSGVAPGTVQVQ